MRNIVGILVIAAGLFLTVQAQAPHKMSYQAVIRNSSNELVINNTVGIRISILEKTGSGAAIYSERQTPATNVNGLISIEIGTGTVLVGNFSTIDWSDGPYFLMTEVDPAGGTSYGITAVSELLSVPYALYAETAGGSGAVGPTGPQGATGPTGPAGMFPNGTAPGNTTYWNGSEWVVNSANVFNNGGNVGVGTFNPQQKLDVNGAVKIGNTAQNKAGTIRWTGTDFEGYNGSEWVSLTSGYKGGVVDASGNGYGTVYIGSQEWMIENLRTTKYCNGDNIPFVSDSAAWANLNTGAYTWYENDNSNEYPYGKLYNYYAVKDSRNICPCGWRVPTYNDWADLIDELGFPYVAGGKMKETGLAHWDSPNIGATNESGFTGLPGGMRTDESDFEKMGAYGYFWSSTENSATDAWTYFLYNQFTDIFEDIFNKEAGMSVRCIRD